MGNDRYLEDSLVYIGHGQADAVDGNGAFLHDIVQNLRRGLNGDPDRILFPADGLNPASTINMTAHDMPAESTICSHGPF